MLCQHHTSNLKEIPFLCKVLQIDGFFLLDYNSFESLNYYDFFPSFSPKENNHSPIFSFPYCITRCSNFKISFAIQTLFSVVFNSSIVLGPEELTIHEASVYFSNTPGNAVEFVKIILEVMTSGPKAWVKKYCATSMSRGARRRQAKRRQAKRRRRNDLPAKNNTQKMWMNMC